MRFVKLHGYGNDYIVIEEESLVGVGRIHEFVRQICDRHFGAGADGVALISRPHGDEPGDFSDFAVRIFNPDGSEAAMSGNGSRCAAAYLYFRQLWSQDPLRLATRAGVKTYRLREANDAGNYCFEAEIGRPLFESAAIPMLTAQAFERVIDYPLAVEGENISVTALQMCNPNCCVFVDDFDRINWRRIGRAIETHAQFPEKTNVEFIRVLNRSHIEVRIWERGVGETLSSGTGSCAAVVAAIINNVAERRVRVTTPGGDLQVEWREIDGEVVLIGTAEVIYRGEWIKS
ncbi:MAG: diaminopimelate epimerase [Pyrinomonadaceae bacterium]